MVYLARTNSYRNEPQTVSGTATVASMELWSTTTKEVLTTLVNSPMSPQAASPLREVLS